MLTSAGCAPVGPGRQGVVREGVYTGCPWEPARLLPELFKLIPGINSGSHAIKSGSLPTVKSTQPIAVPLIFNKVAKGLSQESSVPS